MAKPGGKKKPVKKTVKKTAKKKAAKKTTAAAPKKLARPSVVHWEVQAKDPAGQQRFFAELFGWHIDANNPMSYGMVSSGGKEAIDGGIAGTEGAPCVTVYVQVPEINVALDRALALGGRAVMPRTDVGMVVMAQFRDPEGNIIGLIEG